MPNGRYVKAFTDISPDKKLINITKGRVIDMANSKLKRYFRGSAMLAAVLALITVFAGVGFATGWFQSVFGGMGDVVGLDLRADYEKLSEFANKEISSETKGFDLNDSATVGVNESYYDGDQLFASFVISFSKAAPDFGFSDEHEEFSNLSPMVGEGYAVPLPRNSGGSYLSAYLTDAEVAEFERLFAENGKAGVAYYDYYMGDGVTVNGEYASPEADAYGENADGTLWRYIEFGIPLPEAAQNAESLETSIRVYRTPCYYYKDASGEYRYIDNKNRVSLDFIATITRNDSEKRDYYALSAGDDYSSKFHVSVTPVNARLEIETEVSELWQSAEWDVYGGRDGIDYIYHWIVYVDGVRNNSWATSSSRYGSTGSFAVGADATEITLTPLYVISGEHAGESVSISLK